MTYKAALQYLQQIQEYLNCDDLDSKNDKLLENVRELGLGSWTNIIKVLGIVLFVISIISGIALNKRIEF